MITKGEIRTLIFMKSKEFGLNLNPEAKEFDFIVSMFLEGYQKGQLDTAEIVGYNKYNWSDENND